MAHRISLFHLQILLIVLLSNGGPFFGVNGPSLTNAKKYSGTSRQDAETGEPGRYSPYFGVNGLSSTNAKKYSGSSRQDSDGEEDRYGSIFGVNGLSSTIAKKYSGSSRQDAETGEPDSYGPVDNAEIQQSLEYLVDLIEEMMNSLNVQDSQSSIQPYPDMVNTLPWDTPLALLKRSDCCSPDYPDTCVLDPYRPHKCVRGIDVDPPPIEPMEKSQLRQIMLPHPATSGPTETYLYGSFSQNDFPNMFDPYFEDIHRPVSPLPIYPTNEWDSEPIFPKFDPQSPPPPPNTPWPPIVLDNLPKDSMPHYFRNELQAKPVSSEPAQGLFWPWHQNRPKTKPRPQHQPRGVKQATFDAQYVKVTPDESLIKSAEEWLNQPLTDKAFNEVTFVLPGGVLSKGPKMGRRRKASNRF